MRVAVLTPCFHSEYAFRLAEGMGPDVELLILTDTDMPIFCREELVSRLKVRGTVKMFPSGGRPIQVVRTAWMLAQLLWFRPQLIHAQEYPELYSVLVSRLLYKWIPIALTVHDPIPHSGRDAYYAERTRHRALALRAQAAMILVNGAHCRKDMALPAAGARTDAVEVTHGVATAPEAGEEHAPEAKRILFFGRIEAYKGLETLLDAADILLKRGVVFSVRVAGRGSDLDRLRARIAALPNTSLNEGFLTPKEATEEFQSAAVVVLPYTDATQSGVAASAFANGRPVVATDVGGLSEVVTPEVNGLLVAPKRADELADALERILSSDELYETLSAGAREAARTKLNWQNIGRSTYALYRKMIGLSGSPVAQNAVP